MAEKTDLKTIKGKMTYPEMTEEDRPLYANYVLVNSTPWDFALHFGLVISPIIPNPDESGMIEIPVKKVVSVNIPVPLMKGLIKALQTNVDRYEKERGKITAPREDDK